LKTLVVYYSRTGNTRTIGEELAAVLGANVEELDDGQERRSPVGYLRSGLEARMRKRVGLKPLQHDPATYDLLVVGSPVWISTVSTPVRAFLELLAGSKRQVAWFCTYGPEEEKYPARAFEAMTAVAKLTPVATLRVRTQDVHGDHLKSLQDFAAEVKSRRQKVSRQEEHESR